MLCSKGPLTVSSSRNSISYMRRDSRLSLSLHVLLHMAMHDSPVRSEDLGESMGANPVVIRRTMAGLRNAGLVDSVKGHGGGWSVARDLKDISLLDIYRALDEPILIQQHRGTEKPECLVEQTVGRALNETFQAAEDLIIERFTKIRLSELSAEFHLLLERSLDGKQETSMSGVSRRSGASSSRSASRRGQPPARAPRGRHASTMK